MKKNNEGGQHQRMAWRNVNGLQQGVRIVLFDLNGAWGSKALALALQVISLKAHLLENNLLS